MSRASLDAMLEAIHAHIELPRRAIRTAARLQGTAALHYFDLEAPQIAAPEEKSLSWDDAYALKYCYSGGFVLSKSIDFIKMHLDWRNNLQM